MFIGMHTITNHWVGKSSYLDVNSNSYINWGSGPFSWVKYVMIYYGTPYPIGYDVNFCIVCQNILAEESKYDNIHVAMNQIPFAS